MTTIINHHFRASAPAIRAVLDGDFSPLRTFCNGRNTVHLVEIGQRKMVLKIFKPTNFFTGLVYTFFRKSKARRAYEHALKLQHLGIDTPTPVAYRESSRMGLFHRGYFISEYIDCPTADSIFYNPSTDSDTLASLAGAMADFTLQLHLKGVQPLDYNTGNLLVKSTPEGDYHFWLIDINRMRFGRVPGLRRSMRSFFQLGTYPRDYFTLLGPYCHKRGYDFETSLYHVLRYRRAQQRLRRVKKLIRRLLHMRRGVTPELPSSECRP